MTHPVVCDQRRSRDGGCCGTTRLGGDHRVGSSVNDEGGKGQPFQCGCSVTGRKNRRRLASWPVWVVGAVVLLPATCRRQTSSLGKPGDRNMLYSSAVKSLCSARFRGVRRAERATARVSLKVGRVKCRDGPELIEVRVRTRVVWRIANVWATVPPIENPTTCARSQPWASATAKVSSAMSSSR